MFGNFLCAQNQNKLNVNVCRNTTHEKMSKHSSRHQRNTNCGSRSVPTFFCEQNCICVKMHTMVVILPPINFHKVTLLQQVNTDYPICLYETTLRHTLHIQTIERINLLLHAPLTEGKCSQKNELHNCLSSMQPPHDSKKRKSYVSS